MTFSQCGDTAAHLVFKITQSRLRIALAGMFTTADYPVSGLRLLGPSGYNYHGRLPGSYARTSQVLATKLLMASP